MFCQGAPADTLLAVWIDRGAAYTLTLLTGKHLRQSANLAEINRKRRRAARLPESSWRHLGKDDTEIMVALRFSLHIMKKNFKGRGRNGKSFRLLARKGATMDHTTEPASVSERFGRIDTIEPHLQRKAEEILSKPDVNKRHHYFRYSRNAVALARGEREIV